MKYNSLIKELERFIGIFQKNLALVSNSLGLSGVLVPRMTVKAPADAQNDGVI